jgi:hypothetical protein
MASSFRCKASTVECNPSKSITVAVPNNHYNVELPALIKPLLRSALGKNSFKLISFLSKEFSAFLKYCNSAAGAVS